MVSTSELRSGCNVLTTGVPVLKPSIPDSITQQRWTCRFPRHAISTIAQQQHRVAALMLHRANITLRPPHDMNETPVIAECAYLHWLYRIGELTQTRLMIVTIGGQSKETEAKILQKERKTMLVKNIQSGKATGDSIGYNNGVQARTYGIISDLHLLLKMEDARLCTCEVSIYDFDAL